MVERATPPPPQISKFMLLPPPPPPPPQISTPEINQHWLELFLSMYYSFFVCNLHEMCLLEVEIPFCVHSYMESNHNPRFPILVQPPQVVTCSSASAAYCYNAV